MHTCPDCGQACNCNGDIDDIMFPEDSSESMKCIHCDSSEQTELEEHEFSMDLDLSLHGYISLSDVVEEIRLLADSMSTHKSFSKKVGISPQFLCDILAGKRLPGKKILDFLKLKPVIVYREVK